MKKARKTAARASAKKPAKKAASKAAQRPNKKADQPAVNAPDAQVEVAAKATAKIAAPAAEKSADEPAPQKPKRGLGSLGRSSLERPEIVPSLVLIPAHKSSSAPSRAASITPPTSLKKIATDASRGEAFASNQSALALYLRDELRSLLALLDEPPPSL